MRDAWKRLSSGTLARTGYATASGYNFLVTQLPIIYKLKYFNNVQ
jgi:hypothetical protein